MFRTLSAALVSLVITALMTMGLAFAQVPNTVPPYNTDMTTALFTNTNATAGTTSTTAKSNVDKQGVICVFTETAHSGSPSTTIGIDGFDAATNTWYNMVTSGIASTGQQGATQVPTVVVAVRPGVQTSSLPTGWTALNMALPRTWRVTQIITGSGFSPATTSKVGCNLVR